MDREIAQNMIKSQVDLDSYLDNLLTEIGMQTIPEEQKKQMKQLLMTTLEKFFITRVTDRADEAQVEEMTEMLSDEEGIFRVMDYVKENLDTEGTLLDEVLADFRQDIVAKMNNKE